MSKQIEQESMKAPAEENGRLLTDKDIRKCAWRWCMSVNGFNYETQLAPSVVFSEADALKKIYRDDDAAYRDSLTNWLFGGFCGRDSGIGPAQRAKTTIWN